MTFELYAAFIAAATVLMLIPGPNVALIAANSAAHGPRAGLATVAGTSAALIPQLALVAAGMSGVLGLAGRWFAALRLAGAAYLVWLGLRAWLARAHPDDEPRPALGVSAAFRRGFLVSLTNPKTLAFYAALLPQFVTGDHPGRQLWLLAATALTLAVTIDSGWALLAGRLGPLVRRHRRLTARTTGAVLVAAGAGLAFARGGK